MTTNTRTEARLPEVLEELYLGRTPDYRDEVVAAAVQNRQRPWWTFPGRWLPMADIASRPAYAPRLPWRTITVAFLIGALLLVAAIAYIGSRQPRVPLPFGLAANGVIVFESEGDIHTLDPRTGQSVAIVTGPERDTAPMFSPDGTHILFRRAAIGADGTADAVDLVVVDATGSNPIVVNPAPLVGDPGVDWSFDSASVVSEISSGTGLVLYDATRTAEARTLSTDASAYGRPFRPPHGQEILLIGTGDDGWQLSLLDLENGDQTVLVPGLRSAEYGGASWSPDGSQVVFSRTPPSDFGSRRLFLVNADGTGMRQITDAPGRWYDIDPVWSPDGSRIAFTRYEETSPGTWAIRRTGIYDVASGTVADAGPLPRDVRAQAPTAFDEGVATGESFFLDWSPDGRSLIAHHSEAPGHIVLIDPDSGGWNVLDAVTGTGWASQAWQRLGTQP